MVLICQWLGANMAVFLRSCISHIIPSVDDSGQSFVSDCCALTWGRVTLAAASPINVEQSSCRQDPVRSRMSYLYMAAVLLVCLKLLFFFFFKKKKKIEIRV